jgi:hypothetical protein
VKDVGGRLDVKYWGLVKRHEPLVEELLTQPLEKLIELARLLPFRKEAADAVYPSVHGMDATKLVEKLDGIERQLLQRQLLSATGAERDAAEERLMQLHRGKDENEEDFAWRRSKMLPATPKPHETRRWTRDLAAYVADACDGHLSRVMASVLANRKKDLERLRQMKALIELLQAAGLTHCYDAARGKE